MSFRISILAVLVVCFLASRGVLFAQYQHASPLPAGMTSSRYPIPTHHTRTNTVMHPSEVAPHDPPAPSLYATPFDRKSVTVKKWACGRCAGCQVGKGCIAHRGMAGPCDIPAAKDPLIDGCLIADGKHTCGKPCEEHLDLYGYPLQYVYGKEETKRRLFRPYEFYPGTLGRQAWAYTFGYADASQNYRFYKPAAYMSHEYVAAINRAVWEQLDARRSREAYDAILKDIPKLQEEVELAMAKVKEWQDYVDQLLAMHGFLPGDDLRHCPHQHCHCEKTPCHRACRHHEQASKGSKTVTHNCRSCCPECCEIMIALSWLEAARATLAQAETDLATGEWLVKERKEYMEFAIERARNSKKTANMSAFHQRVLVKPPLKRADSSKQTQHQEEYDPSG